MSIPRDQMAPEVLEAASKVIELAMAGKRTTVATAESCTGGLLGAALTSVPGSSAVYLGGVISYSNSVKQSLLGVPRATLDRWGAVSPQVAAAMGASVRSLLRSAIGVGVTGVAGPDGSERKPVGLIYVAINSGRSTRIERLVGDHGRHGNRSSAVALALLLLAEELHG